MIKPTIIAIGSSLFIADEVATMCQSILSNAVSIQQSTTNSITEAKNNTIYICATTQEAHLKEILPHNQLVIFDLQPTTLFFLDIAKIPDQETVYIFNNLQSYINVLTAECERIIVNKNLKFKPIPYEEMSQAEVINNLKKAKYLIGVNRFINNKDLMVQYGPYIGKETKIISGKRTPSVPSSIQFLKVLIETVLDNGYAERSLLLTSIEMTSPAFIKQTQELALELAHFVDVIRHGLERIITNQIQLTPTDSETDKKNTLSLDSEKTTNTMNPKINTASNITNLTMADIDEYIKELEYLKEKI